MQYENGSQYTLHKGLVLTKSSELSYLNYCNKILKSYNYYEDIVTQITFNYFLIEKSREEYYIDKWSELKMNGPQAIRLVEFSKGGILHKMPANRNYKTTLRSPALRGRGGQGGRARAIGKLAQPGEARGRAMPPWRLWVCRS